MHLYGGLLLTVLLSGLNDVQKLYGVSPTRVSEEVGLARDYADANPQEDTGH